MNMSWWVHSFGACGRSVFQTGTKSSTWKVRVVTCSCEDGRMNSRSGCAQGMCVPKVSESPHEGGYQVHARVRGVGSGVRAPTR